MAHISPAVYLVWALLSTMLGAFLVYHLWSFDRFNCLRWNHGPYSGVFKRVMTYSYLLSVPLIIIYSTGFAAIKYTYGFTKLPLFGIMPTPYFLWGEAAQNAVFPLHLSISLAWACEMVTHLEELCFWLFVVNSSSARQDWFRSVYFKLWAVGSCVAAIVMPSVTISTRLDVYKCEATTFLAGGLGSLMLTIWFLPVLFSFPSFLGNLKEHDVERSTLLRLTKFHERNYIRVVFRFLFTIPIVILGIDGVRPQHHINENMLATDFLALVAGIGCFVSSGLTLVIFFPRSTEHEMALSEQMQTRRKKPIPMHDITPLCLSITHPRALASPASVVRVDVVAPECDTARYPASETWSGLPAYEVAVARGGGGGTTLSSPGLTKWPETPAAGRQPGRPVTVLQPNRRTESGVELGGVWSPSELEMARGRGGPGVRQTSVNELVYHWRSPLEIQRPWYPR